MIGFWTIERIDKLFTMVAGGHSFSAIGTEIGCGRNAAIGKYNRTRVARGIHTPKARAAVGQRKASVASREPKLATGCELPLLRAVEPLPRVSGVSIVDVTGCRYAIADDPALPGGLVFCNAGIDKDRSYCAEHARIVYAKPPKPGTAKRYVIPTALLRIGAR